jgi:hypothetical protein
MAVERKRELKRRRSRKKKLKKLKLRMAEASTVKEREALLDKIKRIQPEFEPK